jgi:hypothetical protein
VKTVKFNHERNVFGIPVKLPKPPLSNEIDGHNLKKKDQRFTPPTIPKNFDLNDPSDDDYKFIDREWERRENGYWFYNNGNVEYITGLHYFYLSYWNIPVTIRGRKKLGLPSWVDSDRDYFYLWNQCCIDPNCFGLIYVTNRRDGKTHRANCTLYEGASKTEEAEVGIQSKTNSDAKAVFNKLVKSWQSMHQMWKPVDTGDSKPSTKLEFNEPAKRNTKNQKKTYGEVLRSEITYQNVKDEAYDGYGLFLYLMDEYGKTVDGNVYNRWNIVKECFSDGSTITGKAILTTTVEELERKGGINALKIWQESDYYDKGIIGRTKSGLYRAFKPASYGLRGVDEKGVSFIDEYGYSDEKRTKEYHLKVRSTLSGEALSSYKRKYPLDEEEAFMMDAKDSPFDLNRVQEQISFNNHNDVHSVRGNFAWANGEKDTSVLWHPDPSGRWLINWHPKAEHRNKWTTVNGYKKPTGTSIVSGVDPFDHKTTTDSRKSNAACYGLKKFDPMNPEGSNCFVSEYINRPSTPEMFYEDILMQNVYFSSEVLIENNKPGILNYFRMRGYYGYLMMRPESTQTKFSKKSLEPGIPMSGEAARDALVNSLVTYIYDNVGYNKETDTYGTCPFNELLTDWIRFDVNKWTDYDSTVASGLAILASLKPVVETITFNVTQFHKKFNNNGGQSRIIN